MLDDVSCGYGLFFFKLGLILLLITANALKKKKSRIINRK